MSLPPRHVSRDSRVWSGIGVAAIQLPLIVNEANPKHVETTNSRTGVPYLLSPSTDDIDRCAAETALVAVP